MSTNKKFRFLYRVNFVDIIHCKISKIQKCII